MGAGEWESKWESELHLVFAADRERRQHRQELCARAERSGAVDLGHLVLQGDLRLWGEGRVGLRDGGGMGRTQLPAAHISSARVGESVAVS